MRKGCVRSAYRRSIQRHDGGFSALQRGQAPMGAGGHGPAPTTCRAHAVHTRGSTPPPPHTLEPDTRATAAAVERVRGSQAHTHYESGGGLPAERGGGGTYTCVRRYHVVKSPWGGVISTRAHARCERGGTAGGTYKCVGEDDGAAAATPAAPGVPLRGDRLPPSPAGCCSRRRQAPHRAPRVRAHTQNVTGVRSSEPPCGRHTATYR